MHKRWVALTISCLLVLAGARVVSAQTAVKTINTSADAYVSSSGSQSNYGGATTLRAQAVSPILRTYTRFTVSGLTAPVSKATLRLYSLQSSSSPIEARSAPGVWTEKGITYANAPKMGVVIGKSGSLPSKNWVDIDVTALIVDNGTFTLALTTLSKTALSVSSREAGKAPQLVVETKVVPPPAPAAPSFYVDSAAGNDTNAGTSPTTPWKSLQKVNSARLAPGTQLLFKRGGTWNGTLSIQASGDATSPIVVGAYDAGPLPVIRDGSSSEGGYNCMIVSGSYVTIREIQADGCAWAGLSIKGSNNRVEKSILSNNAAGLVIAPGSINNVIVGNQIAGNNRMSVLTETPTNDDSGAFGILIEGDANEIANNTISGSDAFSHDYGRDGSAVEIYGGQRNNIHHNLVLQNDTFVELGGSRAADNTLAYNLVRSDLPESLFVVTRGSRDVFGPVSGTKVDNNTAQLTGARAQGFVCYAGCSVDVLSMRNNIIDAAFKAGFADALFLESNNIFRGQLLFVVNALSLVADPKFVDPIAGDLRLQSLSPAIDRGVSISGYTKDLDGKVVPQDGNSDGRALADAGSYEYSKTATATTTSSGPVRLPPAPSPKPAPDSGTSPAPSPPSTPTESPGLIPSLVDGVTGTLKSVTDPLLNP